MKQIKYQQNNECSIAKKSYKAPYIAIVKLDNEISLVLATQPPGGPGENNIIEDTNNESPWE